MGKVKTVTVNEAAEILGVSPRHVRNLCAAGDVECEKEGLKYQIRKVSVKELARKRARAHKEKMKKARGK